MKGRTLISLIIGLLIIGFAAIPNRVYAGDVYKFRIAVHDKSHHRYMINGYPTYHGSRYVIAPYAERKDFYGIKHRRHWHRHRYYCTSPCRCSCKCWHRCSWGCRPAHPPVRVYIPGGNGWYLQFGVSGGF